MTPDEPNQPGTPGDALSAFASALVAGARQADAHPLADPHVSSAFVLGWQMAELYRPDEVRAVPASPDDLPGVGRLGGADRERLAADQVTATLTKLDDPIAHARLAQPDPGALFRALGDPHALRGAVLAFHLELLATLTAADFRLGKAYGLGRALADTCRNPANRMELARELNPYRIATLAGWMDDLSSALPAHAGHSVAGSLQRWCEWLHRLEDGTELPDGTLPLLRKQGMLWRALLSGEKLGQDMLEPGNYLDAADRLAKRTAKIALRAIGRMWWLVLLAVLLFAGGVIVIFAVDTSESIAAGLGGILASVGLTWRGVGNTLGALGAKLEQPLWDAELDIAITDAIMLLPDNDRDYRGRRRWALSAAKPMPELEGGGR